MECKECCRDISADEYRKNAGYCEKCFSNFIEPKLDETTTTNEEDKIINTSAKCIKVIAIMIGIICFIAGLAYIDDDSNFGLTLIIISIISSIFIYGFGEIIQLLEDIKNK